MSTPLLPALAWALVAPVLLLGLAPLLDGIGRQVRARLESRAGPPWLQGYLDLAKLAGKREVQAAANALTAGTPWVALGSAVAAGLLVPLAGRSPLGFAGDALVLVYLLGLSSAAVALAGTASGNPYGFLGASRELILLVLVEPVVACGFVVLAIHAGTLRLDQLAAWHAANGFQVSTALAAAAVILTLVAYLGRIPFDLSEAEQELMGGVLIEYSGRPLALFRWAMFVRWLVAAWVVAEVFVPTPAPLLLAVPLSIAKVLALFVLAAGLSALVARFRIAHARVVLVQVAVLILFAVAFALVGA